MYSSFIIIELFDTDFLKIIFYKIILNLFYLNS